MKQTDEVALAQYKWHQIDVSTAECYNCAMNLGQIALYRKGGGVVNLYVRTMNDVIDYIEKYIEEPITLQSISQHFFLSAFHFSRLFKVLIGIGVKQYILGRKLSLASERLLISNVPIIDVALEMGFEYPEVFSRAFKKQFGISPTSYRNGNYPINTIPKAFIVERDIINFGGVLTLKEHYFWYDMVDLQGTFIEVSEYDVDFEQTLKSAGINALASYNHSSAENNDFYTVVSCFGDESGRYTVFFGTLKDEQTKSNNVQILKIPAGWYASFSYYGEMLDMRTTFNDDFYRWMFVKEIEPCTNGIGMINIYDRNDMKNVRILVPVKRPK